MMYKEADGSGNPVPTVYCCNVVYENSVGRLLLTEEGYVTLSDKKYHYYLQDHQGNNRVVLSSSGAVEEAITILLVGKRTITIPSVVCLQAQAMCSLTSITARSTMARRG